MAAETRRMFFGFRRRFLEIFLALATPHGFRSNSKENKTKTKKQFLSFSLVKDCGGFKGRLQTLVVIFPRKSTQVKIHTKMAIFWLVFSAKNPVKSNKLALIEGKIWNLVFFDITISSQKAIFARSLHLVLFYCLGKIRDYRWCTLYQTPNTIFPLEFFIYFP